MKKLQKESKQMDLFWLFLLYRQKIRNLTMDIRFTHRINKSVLKNYKKIIAEISS